MANKFQDTVTRLPAAWANTVDWLVFDVFQSARTVSDARTALGLGNLGLQNKNNISVTGGNIDGVTLGSNAKVTVDALRVKCEATPSDNDDVVTLAYFNTHVANTISSALGTAIGNLGNMASQNANQVNITGGTLDSVTIGETSPGSGFFQTLQVNQTPQNAEDAINLQWAQENLLTPFGNLGTLADQNANQVAITGGAINGVRLGNLTPCISGVFTKLVVSTDPTADTDVANKRYVQAILTQTLSGVGTIASQDSDAVNLTGGRINGVSIGDTTPDTGSFTEVLARSNQALFTADTISSAISNIAGMRITDNNVQVGGMLYYGSQNQLPSRVSIWAENLPLSIHTFDAQIALNSDNSIVLSADLVKINTKTLVNAATANGPAELTVGGEVYAALDLRTSAQAFNNVAGNIALATDQCSSFYVSIMDAVTLSFGPNVAGQTGMLRKRVVIQQANGGKSVTWPANVHWAKGGAPNYSSALLGYFDVIELYSVDGGATWLAMSAYF